MNRNILWAKRMETRVRAATAPRPKLTTTAFAAGFQLTTYSIHYYSDMFFEGICDSRPKLTTYTFRYIPLLFFEGILSYFFYYTRTRMLDFIGFIRIDKEFIGFIEFIGVLRKTLLNCFFFFRIIKEV